MAKKEARIERTITDFLNKEYKDYSMYVAENRALVSLIDGLKTGARKIMHSAFIGSLKNGDQKKVPNLAGETLNYTLYPHGDGSLNGTIVTLSQEHKFNLNPLYIDSQNGSLRADKASSPRYLYVRLSKYAKLLRVDSELTELLYDEGQYIEPKFFLPIIPIGLCQRQEGMCPGYKYSCMSYNPIDIIDACVEVLKSKKKENRLEGFVIHPYVRGIKPKNWKLEDGKWVNYGEFKYDENRKEITITDLPYDVEFDKFESLLNKYKEKEEIKDWKDYSEEENIKYVINCKKGSFGTQLKGRGINKKIESKFKLRKVMPDDLLRVLDENKKIRDFATPHEQIEYFVDYRVTRYTDRKKRLAKIIEERLQKNTDLIKFIELVCKGKLKIRNRSKKDIKVDMNNYKLTMELISTPMSKVTIEERDELLKQNEEIKKELEYIKKTSEKQMYLNDLAALRKELEKDFK